MNDMPADRNRRVLVIDDNRSIHDDFRKILSPAIATAAALDVTEAALFGGPSDAIRQTQFKVDSAYQGQEGALLVRKAVEAGLPYAMAFVDVRMPPGWDGVETTRKIWELDPDIQIVLCTAYSDYSWDELFEKLGFHDGLLILKKPFDAVEAFQLAHALTEKWWLHQQSRRKMEELESRVAERTRELQQSNHALQTEVNERERAQSFLHSVVEHLPIAVFIKEAKELRFVLWNKAGEKLTGITNAEMMGKNDHDFFPQNDADLYTANDRAAFEQRGVLEIPEEVIQTRDRGARITHVWKVPMFDATGQPAFLLGISEDITERKQAAEALRQSEARFRLLVEESPDAIGIYQEGKLVFINSTGTRLMFAKSQEELLGRKSEQIIHPDDLAGATDRIRRRLAGETGMYPAEVRYLRLDGTTVPVEVSAAPVTFKGKPAVQFIARDITERKQIEESLRASQANMAAAQRIAHFGSWELELTKPNDVDANALRWSDEMFRIAGYEPGAVEVSRELFFRLVHPADREPVRQAVATAIRERERYSIVHRLIRPDGDERMVHETAEIIFDEQTGRPLKIIGTAHDITEQRKAEEALRESEERFSGAFEYAPIGVALVSPDGHWLKVNRALCALVGYSEAELLTRTFQDITHPEDLEGDLENVRRMIAGEIRSYQMEKRYVHRRGHLVTVLLNVSLVRDSQGRPRYFISQIQDITERKQTENALRASDEKFHQLADNITDAFWIRSPDMREVHYISPAFERIWGRSVASLYANPQQWSDFIVPEDRARVLGAFAALTKDAPSMDIEYRIVRPGGEIRWVRVRGFQVRNTADKLIRHTGIVTDITERQRAVEELRESERRFSDMLRNLELVSMMRDRDARITYCNDYLLRLTGWRREEVIGRDWFELFVPPELVDALRGVYTALLADQPVAWHYENEIVTRAGARRLIRWNNSVLRSASGEVIGTASIGEDITERKRLEAQLFQSQKMETVGKLAGGIAHEFNSILTAIIGQSELLLEDLPAGDPLTENAAEIRKAADRAATLTRQLLAYGRKQFLQPETLDLNRVIAGMDGMFRHLLGGEVDVRIAPAEGLHAVKADAGQIEQVIVNMAMNAADAMPNGGKLTLETANVAFDQESVGRYPELKPGDYVMLAFTDTGTGMSEAVKARAFEPFFSTKGVGEGTGLGLSTCYGIIKQSGGHISVYSEPGRGTTFKIYLPQAEPQTKIPLQGLDSPDLPGGTETILLVEDDPALRELAATLLRRLGYTILSAANGIEALSLNQQRDIGHIDLLFTDLVMPHMSGKELVERVRASFPHTRILFTSAYTENAIVHQGVLNKGVALLQKPFTPSALAHKLREVLDQPDAPKPDPAQKTNGFTKIADE